MKIVYALLCLALARWIIAYEVYHSLPLSEIKRRARSKDKKFTALYRVASYRDSQAVLLWLAGISAGTVLLIWSARTNWWLAAIVVVVTVWMMVWPRFSAEGRAGGLVAIFAPLDTFLLSQLNPILSRLARLRPRHGEPVSTGLYEKRDILEFLRRQNEQAGNRVPEADLLIAFHALQFGDKQVARVMTPRRQVKMVKADETAGPILTDELHKTGFSRFPVVKDSVKATHPQIIGTLYLNDLIGYEGNGKVKDLADRKVYFINEDSNLHQALSAFLKTHHHLLIVVNSFEEMVGVLSLEDVLEQIIGKQLRDEFDNYENSRAVASAETEHHSKSEEHPSADAAEAKNPIASSQK